LVLRVIWFNQPFILSFISLLIMMQVQLLLSSPRFESIIELILSFLLTPLILADFQ
jgi:hypothetical protein